MICLPRLYAIIDFAAVCGDDSSPIGALRSLSVFAGELLAGGATLIQYRNKKGSSAEMLAQARMLRLASKSAAWWVLNDRADLCCAAGYDGVHLGTEDMGPQNAHKLGRGTAEDRLWIGVSAHNLEQVRLADELPVDYVAVGPVFATSSKDEAEPVIGLGGISSARKATRKPLVAIGGITRRNCRLVIDAGADSLAVIGDLIAEPRRSVEEFLRILN